MNASFRWLLDLAPDLAPDAEAAAARLSALGFPVEGLEDLASGIRDIVVGHVLEVLPHPNADRLRVCRVDGGDGVRSVVCGAANVTPGSMFPFAPIGATLSGGMQIGKAKLRGELSEGMLCSERELGLGKGQDGLMELGPISDQSDWRPGTPLSKVLGLEDLRLEVEVTSNRPDLLSHRGLARELSPAGDRGLVDVPIPGEDAARVAELEALESVHGVAEARIASVGVKVEAPDRCPRYLGLVVRGVQVGPSPTWLQSRLRAAGARPINNVVDATNWVLLEWGQPLHAFDLGQLGGGEVRVRMAAEGESIRTLDGVERRLTPDMLAICDATVPVAVAGVMGGVDSEVSSTTTDLFLECALFTPGPIRATRKALGLSTDASYRFERGVDPVAMKAALFRCARLILATAGGRVEGPLIDVGPGLQEEREIGLRVARVEALLGVSFDALAIEELLTPLGFIVESKGEGSLRVRVPGFRRWDVTREVDLIEEIARRYGYDQFPETLRPFRPGTVPDHPLFRLEDRIRDTLVAGGFLEAQTPAFAPESEGDVELQNPLSSEERCLRRSLLPALLRRIQYNLARSSRDVRLFELGTVFRSGEPGALPQERTHLSLAVHGRRAPEHWAGDLGAFDLWDLRGLLESLSMTLFGTLGSSPGFLVRPGSGAAPGFLDGKWFEVVLIAPDGGAEDPVRCGIGGVVASAELDLPPWAGLVHALEFTLSDVPAPIDAMRVRPLPQHPGVDRDLALLVPDEVPAERVLARARAEGGVDLVDAGVFDVYRGPGLPEGVRSLAVRLRFQAPDRSLVDREVDRAVDAIVQALAASDGVRVRGG